MPALRQQRNPEERPVRSVHCLRQLSGSVHLHSVTQEGPGPDRPSDEICTECGSPMVIKTGRFGEFLACTTYPKCKHTRPVPLGIKCPKCIVGDLAERRTKKGRNFFGCLRYPECDFSVWNRPMPEICPNCGYLGMETENQATGPYRKCLKCLHEEPILEGAAAESVAPPDRAGRRRRPRGQRGRLGAGRARRERHAARDAPRGAHAGRTRPIVSPSWSAAIPSNRWN